MKRLCGTLIVVLVLLASATGIVYGASFVTDGYDVNIIVNRDNSFLVTENINMDFTAPSHGIYRYIPYSGTMYYELDGKKTEKTI